MLRSRRQYRFPIHHTGAVPARVALARVVVVRPALPLEGSGQAWTTVRFGPVLHTGLAPPPVRTWPIRIVRPVLPLEGADQAWATARFGPVLHTGLKPDRRMPFRMVRPVLPLFGTDLPAGLYHMALGPPIWSTRRAFDGDLRGLHRVEDTNIAELLVFRGVDAAPDLDAAPWMEVARSALPATGAFAAGATYHIVVQERNKHGVVSANADATLFLIAGDGSQTTPPPSAPVRIVCSAAAAGAVRVEADYNRLADGDNAADQWVLWQTDDGSEPDPLVDPPAAVVDMVIASAVVHLDRTAGSFGDGTTVRTVVGTRRSSDSSDSDTAASLAVTTNTDGPATPTAALLVPPVAKQVQ